MERKVHRFTWVFGLTGIGLIRFGFRYRTLLPPISFGSEVDFSRQHTQWKAQHREVCYLTFYAAIIIHLMSPIKQLVYCCNMVIILPTLSYSVRALVSIWIMSTAFPPPPPPPVTVAPPPFPFSGDNQPPWDWARNCSCWVRLHTGVHTFTGFFRQFYKYNDNRVLK